MNKREKVAKAFIIPTIAWLLLFTIFPLLYSLRMSFFSIRFGRTQQFVGFQNYLNVFQDNNFWNSIFFTLKFVGISVGIQFIVGLFLAVLVSKLDKFNKWIRTLWVLPLFSTPIATSYLALTIFNEDIGPVNSLLSELFGFKVSWISGFFGANASVILLDVWQWMPFMFLGFYSAIQSFPRSLYEASRVDGATGWQTFRYITFPLLKPVVITLLFLRVTHAFQVFDFSYGLTGGGPGSATETTSLYIYRNAFKHFNLGYASALSYVFFIIILFAAMFFLRSLRKSWVGGSQ
ncbi:MAG: sugar ABC transporter permease [Kosmotoga sp.]|nr:MAG: sugar ABC transporter permease [Kosmotoga sp.]